MHHNGDALPEAPIAADTFGAHLLEEFVGEVGTRRLEQPRDPRTHRRAARRGRVLAGAAERRDRDGDATQ